MEIENAAVLVTGASRGLGRELSIALARAGARVAMVARGEEALEEAVAAANAAARGPHGERGAAHGLAFDVGDKTAIHRIAGAAVALVGNLDVVVHNASTLGRVPMPLLLDTDCEELERVLAVNLLGPFRLTKALAGSMFLRKTGVVAFVSSDAAVSAYARWGAYGVSKAAQDHLARTFAAELDPVRFFAVDPGEMDTKMHADAIPDADRSTLADPRDVALRLVTLLTRAARVPNGARVLASDFPKAELR
ncbi:MAG: SDR family oxidoreductase [Labilithrix sp.]|nr:SDR family oxidoreductase [Labilithrix sp.]